MVRGYLVFGDIEGKLDVLRVECGRCQRKGRYYVRRLIDKYGRNANKEQLKLSIIGTRLHGGAASVSRDDLRSMLSKRGLALTKCPGRAAIGPARRNPNSPQALPEGFGPR